jgi:cation transport regulator ChaB
MSNPTHNLDIHSYSLRELFQLLELPLNPTKEQMFLAKKKVLRFHPDKSNLPNEYFMFYKKAFDTALKYYEEQNRQNRPITEENTTYTTSKANENSSEKNQQLIGKVSGENFNSRQFNDVFEKNMVEKRENLNAWFAEEKAVIDLPENEKVSAKNMNSVFEKIKEKTQSMVVHKGVQDFFSHSGGGKFYDDDEDKNEYISSDPFGKLKFDDLRKVHKDQTIFAVGESDFEKVQKYGSVDHYMRERDRDPVKHTRNSNADFQSQAEKLFMEQEKIKKENHLRRLHESNLKTMQYEEKNKKILASFMQIKN